MATSTTSGSDAMAFGSGEPFPTGPEADACDRASAPDPLIGQVLGGRYRVIERLAEGGMGTVYRAEHIALGKEVAIKLVQDAGNADHAMRFLREAMLTSRIDHPNVISTIDYGTFEHGAAYLVTGLVEGPTLARVMEIERPMSWVRAAEIGAQVADAVAAAQAHGIVHRDLKPENIVLQLMPDGTDVAKVLDFGIAKYARDSLAPPPVRGAQKVTRVGVVVGTPGYMAPEQAVGMRADYRADLYALGVMLWECVVGRRLWDCDDIQRLITAQLGSRPPLVRAESGDPTIPEAFEQLVATLLATRPEKRPQSAVETRDRLRSLVEADRREPLARVDLPPITQPTLIVVTPPPPTSTVFVDAALARWRAAAGDALRDAGRANDDGAAQPETSLILPSVVVGESMRLPTTQVGFRVAASVPQIDVAVETVPNAEPVQELASEVASASAPSSEEKRIDPVVLPRTSLRRYVVMLLGLMLLSAVLWAALARDASTGSSAPRAERGGGRSSGASLVAPAPPPAQRAAAPSTSVAAAASPLHAALASASSKAAPATAARASTKPQLGAASLTSAPREDAAALRAKARAHFARAEFRLAAQSYRLAIKAAPAYAGAYAGLGASQYALGDARGAIASYEQAIRRSPASSGFHAALGRACVMAGDRARALAEYRKAVALDPTNDVASNALLKLTP